MPYPLIMKHRKSLSSIKMIAIQVFGKNGWRNNIITKTTTHKINKPGKHVIKYWMVSPAVVLQKIVGDMGGVLPSYLGPPETRFTTSK
jgi:hypothetical protein